jgi:hypothetical protein
MQLSILISSRPSIIAIRLKELISYLALKRDSSILPAYTCLAYYIKEIA